MKKEKDIRQFIVLRAGNLTTDSVGIDLNDFNNGVYDALHIDCYEHVSLGKFFDFNLHMLVDESGAIKDPRPKLNRLASFLYGQDIYGDALLCTVDNHYNFGPIEGTELFKLCFILKRIAEVLNHD